MNLSELRAELHAASKPADAVILQRFFKTGKGEYGEGDIFIGVKMPAIRALVKKYAALPLNDCIKLLRSKIHEERMTALLIMVYKMKKADAHLREEIYNLYMSNTDKINNWDLVDLSAPGIVGEFLLNQNINELITRAQSGLLWNRRIAVISTFTFIRNGIFEPTFIISEMLLNDKHDLIHKAVGWMLREIGKRNLNAEEIFLEKHYKTMPRTMLRYAIEKFPEPKRQNYLKGRI